MNTLGKLCLALAVTLPWLSSAQGAVISFSNDFSSTGFANQVGFTLGSGQLSVSATGTVTPVAYGSEQFSNATNATYTLTTRFQITSLGTGAGNESVGFGIFGLDSAFTGTGASTRYVFANYTFLGTDVGVLNLNEVDGTNTTLGTNGLADTNGATGGAVTAGSTVYTLRLQVTNTAANTYDLTLGVFNAAGTSQFGTSASVTGYVATAAPGSGYFTGIRSRLANGTGTTTAVYEDFNATLIPEPTAGGLLCLGLGAYAFTRRRSTNLGR